MSSPSTSSHGGKRKRPTTAATTAMMDENPLLQPSSRDASGEDGDTTAPESGRLTHRKTDSASNGANPPSKRQRANSDRNSGPQSSTTSINPDHAPVDPGEPSDTTEASTDIADRVTRKSKKPTALKETHLNGDDENGDDTMAPPPIGKLTHPVGYKTNDPPSGRPVRVYADAGAGQKAFPDVYLLVGVTGDEETHKRKGLTVLSGMERAETVRHCKWVDEVVENCPWIVTPDFLEKHQIDYVAHDDLPYGADEGDDIYKPIKEQGKFLVTQRTEGVSTTGIITKIVRDYEKYIARQFKRGTSRQELNVSWLKKNELDVKRHVQDLRDSIRTNWTTTGQELSKELRQFWPASRPQSPAPRNRAPTTPGAPAGDMTLREVATMTNAARSPTTPGAERGNSNEFISGYTLGLIGGVRSWMTKNRRNVGDNSRPPSRSPSDDESEESDSKPNNRGRQQASQPSQAS
ncbi:cytidylyltransferase [Apiospora hydei]|uniref:choline-phosphate cytidylyltransferase n=1 Tax=Apiospora hydei TaxID=1337664 RepID=A0ABR1WQK4_9PEZI